MFIVLQAEWATGPDWLLWRRGMFACARYRLKICTWLSSEIFSTLSDLTRLHFAKLLTIYIYRILYLKYSNDLCQVTER